MKLSNKTLPDLPAGVAKPGYDRAGLKPGIVHIGVGNFHRAHQAWYLHRLMQDGLAQDWAIIGAGGLTQDKNMRERLLSQDCLTTLIELSPERKSAEVIGSMIDYVPIQDGHAALVHQMADPSIRIVSLTITEGGYFISPTEGGLDENHPDIQHDIQNPAKPRTVFGAIIAALSMRRVSGAGPFAVLSCDNLRGNGRIARQAVVTLAHRIDKDLAGWIEKNCSFPNSMVDCIVPATGPTERALVQSFGVNDAAPVTHESYRQWVIEDDFCAGRPNLEKAGVIFTPEVHAYEAMKIRVLNAGHQVLANAGELLGVETIAECMAHPLISRFFRAVEIEEIVPYVASVPGVTASQYVDLIASRFSNKEIRDTTRRVAFDGSSRHPEFIVPILHDALEAGGAMEGLALVEALWARMCAGKRDDGTLIKDNDPNWDQLSQTATQSAEDPRIWLEQTHIYGEIAKNQRFASAFQRWLSLIWSKGTAVALTTYLEMVNPTMEEALK